LVACPFPLPRRIKKIRPGQECVFLLFFLFPPPFPRLSLSFPCSARITLDRKRTGSFSLFPFLPISLFYCFSFSPSSRLLSEKRRRGGLFSFSPCFLSLFRSLAVAELTTVPFFLFPFFFLFFPPRVPSQKCVSRQGRLPYSLSQKR